MNSKLTEMQMNRSIDLSSSDSDASRALPRYGDLSMEQIQWLLKVVSTSDRNIISGEMRKCTSEMLYTRGLPLAAIVMGSMYYVRQNLPAKYHFGPKGWPFYAILGFGSISLTTLLTANTCSNRIKPVLSQMYEKYSSSAPVSANSYENLRMANRARFSGGAGPSDPVQPSSQLQALSPPDSTRARYDYTRDNEYATQTMSGNAPNYASGDNVPLRYASQHVPSRPVSGSPIGSGSGGFMDDDVSLMPGTPYNIGSDTISSDILSDSSSKSRYGDSGFS